MSGELHLFAIHALDGVGEARAGKYGAPFLAAIASAVAEPVS